MDLNEMAKILASTSDGKLTESDIRAMVGAPDTDELTECTCGKPIDKCDDSYAHITSGA